MRQYNSKLILIAGFGTVILIVAALMFIRISSVVATEKNLKEIYSHKKQNHLLGEMRDAARLRALLLHRMGIVADEFERDEAYIQFKEEAGKFIAARMELLAMEDEMGVEKQIWYTIKPVIISGQSAQIEAAERYLLGEDATANKIMLEQVIPIQNTVILALTDIIKIQKQSAERHFNYSLNRFNRLYYSAISMGSMAILLILVIAIIVVRRTVKIESSLSDSRDAAQQATEQKSQFLANMSHEIRTPLAAVIGFAASLLEDDISDKESKYCKQRIINNGQHLAQLINDILDFSKIEAGLLAIETIPVSVVDLVLDIKSLLGHIAKEKGLEFRLNFKYPLPSMIETDPTRLRQIILNLCSNAIKFTERGRISLDVSYDQNHQHLHIGVSDTGIGMSETEQQHLFEFFAQADISTSRKYGGTGLGLSISNQLAHLLDGDISCKSVPGEGSQFVLVISAKQVSGTAIIHTLDEQKNISNNNQNSKIPALSGKILLAEDGKDNQAIVKLMLRRTGVLLDIVENGKQVLETLSDKTYDLILMDMQMPEMGGAEALKHIRESGNKTPVVMLTANAMQDEQQRCNDLGANEFLTKPIDKLRFYQTLATLLNAAESNEIITQDSDEQYDSDFEIIREQFLVELPGCMSKIKQNFKHSNFKQAGFEIHRLKGLGTSLGFSEITRLSREIENLMKEKQYAIAQDMLLEMDSYCYRVNEKENLKKAANS